MRNLKRLFLLPGHAVIRLKAGLSSECKMSFGDGTSTWCFERSRLLHWTLLMAWAGHVVLCTFIKWGYFGQFMAPVPGLFIIAFASDIYPVLLLLVVHSSVDEACELSHLDLCSNPRFGTFLIIFVILGWALQLPLIISTIVLALTNHLYGAIANSNVMMFLLLCPLCEIVLSMITLCFGYLLNQHLDNQTRSNDRIVLQL